MPSSRPSRPHANLEAYRTVREATKALQSQFSVAKLPAVLPVESRRLLQSFIEEHEGEVSEEESAKANLELKSFWEQYVGEPPSRQGAFVGVLRELRPAIVREADLVEWWQRAVKPVVTGVGYPKTTYEDAQEFLVDCMVYDDEDEDEGNRARTLKRLMADLLNIYLARTRGLTDEDRFIAPENAQVAQRIENVLVAYGRKQPSELFNSLDDLIIAANTRLQGLTLLSSFLRHQTPHLYLVVHTPLIEHLLKCLMNDTSTTVLSVALNSLIMLLPHIPNHLGEHLPRLFLVYSRLLCWEKFSPLSTEAQKSLVTDDRVLAESDGDYGDVGIDPNWEKVRPKDGMIESTTPELMTYFTYLYGLYPLHFMNYIRKPRRYLKQADFPGAEDFDLDQVVIHIRTEQFRQVHLMHPNFYNMTLEEELIDPKWPKTDPADVVAECNALCINTKPALISPGPPPTGKLPEPPQLPFLANMKNSPQLSPSTSHASFRSGNSWRDTQSTAVSGQPGDADSPILRPHALQSDDDSAALVVRPRSKATNRTTSPSLDDFPHPAGMSAGRSPRDKEDAPQTNLAYLQRENTLLRNELNFERWHKAQYSQHIGQLTRKNVKDATAEAETLNLINANRAMKVQLEQVRLAREATIKDSSLTRKQANNLESNLAERFMQMKKEQETWRANAEELKRLRKEVNQYRDLLVAGENRELNKSHQLEIVKRQLEDLQDVQSSMNKAEHKLRDYEFRDFEMKQAKRELEILLHEKETLQMRVQRHAHDHERTRRAYADKVAELEAQLDSAESGPRRGFHPNAGPDTQMIVQQAIAESQAKLNQLRKKHTALMEKFTDLEMEYESVKSQLDAMQGNRGGNGHTFLHDNDGDTYSYASPDRSVMSGALSSRDDYDMMSDINPISQSAYITSASDPSQRRFQPHNGGLPVSPPASEATFHRAAGLTWKPPTSISRQDSLASRGSSQPATTFNQTAPLSQDEMVRGSGKSAFSERSDDSAPKKKEKMVKAADPVRVYGRGGAQNIKLKSKDKDKDGAEKPEKKGGFRGFKNLV